MTRRPIEVLLHHLPGVVARAENEWARGFALSLMRQAKRPTWKPSPKQLLLADKLVSELFREDDVDVIEDDDA